MPNKEKQDLKLPTPFLRPHKDNEMMYASFTCAIDSKGLVMSPNKPFTYTLTHKNHTNTHNIVKLLVISSTQHASYVSAVHIYNKINININKNVENIAAVIL